MKLRLNYDIREEFKQLDEELYKEGYLPTHKLKRHATLEKIMFDTSIDEMFSLFSQSE